MRHVSSELPLVNEMSDTRGVRMQVDSLPDQTNREIRPATLDEYSPHQIFAVNAAPASLLLVVWQLPGRRGLEFVG